MRLVSAYSQFQNYDPKDGNVPACPFYLLPDIARRARLILHRRNGQEINTAAEKISDVLTSYFEDAEQQFIDDQLRSNGWVCKYLDMEACNADGIHDLISRGLPDTAGDDEYFDFPTKDNTTALQALKSCTGIYRFDDERFGKPQQPELFAVLALSYVEDCLGWLTRDRGQPNGKRQVAKSDKGGRSLYPESPVNLVLAGNDALCAMESACYAEHIARMAPIDEQLATVRGRLRRQSSQVDELAEKKAATMRTEVARKAADGKRQTNAWKQEAVIRFYEEHGASYKSVEEAVRAILDDKLVPEIVHRIAPRTVVDWIHAYRKRRSAGRSLTVY